MNNIYLDNNATTRVKEEVFEAMRPYYTEVFGNASSKFYQVGINAQKAVDAAKLNL